MYLGVTGIHFLNYDAFLSLKNVLISGNSADPDEMSRVSPGS